MGERVEERTGGNRKFTGKACAQGAAGVAGVSSFGRWGLSWEWLGGRDLSFSSNSASCSPSMPPWARHCLLLSLGFPTPLCKWGH